MLQCVGSGSTYVGASRGGDVGRGLALAWSESEQSRPHQPSSHIHMRLSQLPCPLHACRHAPDSRTSHAAPPYPAWHAHRALPRAASTTQEPRWVHAPAQRCSGA